MCEVTLAIPLYNAEKYIFKTMQSALSQSFDDIEFLVVDDHSSDNSICIIESFMKTHLRGSFIRLITNDINLGAGESRNIAIREAKGKYIFFLDSDDLIAQNCIEILYNSIQSKEAQISIGSYQKCYENGKIIDVEYLPNVSGHLKGQFAQLIYGNLKHFRLIACNALYKIDFLKKNHIFFFKSNSSEDTIFVTDLIPVVESFVLSRCITYTYVIRPNSLSQYNVRNSISLSEINLQMGVRFYQKDKMMQCKQFFYFPEMCLYLTRFFFTSSFFVVANMKKIRPAFDYKQIKELLSVKLSLKEVLCFRKGKFMMLFFYVLGMIPSCLQKIILFCSYRFYTMYLPHLRLLADNNKLNN